VRLEVIGSRSVILFNFSAKLIKVVVALVGRAVPNSVLKDIESFRKVNLNSGLRAGAQIPYSPPFGKK
jgi:hypothetical protein